MKILEFLIQNVGTIAVSLVLAFIVALLVWSLVKDKRAGRSGCGGGCQGCPMSGKCHGGANGESKKS